MREEDRSQVVPARRGLESMGVVSGYRRLCPSCAGTCSQEAKFCPHCGKPAPPSLSGKLDKDASSPEPQTRTGIAAELPALEAIPRARPAANVNACSCGQQLPPDARYCLHCGLSMKPTSHRYQVVPVAAGSSHQATPIPDEGLVIGKGSDCGMEVAKDDYVSRRHARLCWKDGDLYLEDLGSSNGTYMRVRNAVQIKAGDEILVGTSMLRVEEVAP
jgi:hypothetical protein